MTVSSKVWAIHCLDAFPAHGRAHAEGFARGDIEAIDKGIFVRALAEARTRNPGTALARYIESYITVQVSAVSLQHGLGHSLGVTSV